MILVRLHWLAGLQVVFCWSSMLFLFPFAALWIPCVLGVHHFLPLGAFINIVLTCASKEVVNIPFSFPSFLVEKKTKHKVKDGWSIMYSCCIIATWWLFMYLSSIVNFPGYSNTHSIQLIGYTNPCLLIYWISYSTFKLSNPMDYFHLLG